jgi:hypothetical protein
VCGPFAKATLLSNQNKLKIKKTKREKGQKMSILVVEKQQLQ